MIKFDPSHWNEQVYTTKDLLRDIPVTNHLCKPVLVLPSLNIWYGIPGSLKTNILMDLAASTALGQHWLKSFDGFPGFECVRSPVLWMDCDSGKDILHERFSAFLRGHAATEAQAAQACIYYMSFPSPAFSATNDVAITALIEIANKRQAKLLVFDNLGTISGGADENSFEMVTVMNNLRFIAEKTGSSVNVIHHIAKSFSDTNHKNTRHTPRGHSSIEAAIDIALLIDREGDGISIEPTKCRRASFDPFIALFEFEHYPHTETLKTARFIGDEGAPNPISVAAENAIAKWMKAHRCECNQKELIEACKGAKIGRPRALSEIHRLVHKNCLALKPNQVHNQSIYRWTKRE